MDNIKYRLEFFQNENVEIIDFSHTEVNAISAMKNLINASLDNRFFILATMQYGLRIDFKDYQNYYTNWLNVPK